MATFGATFLATFGKIGPTSGNTGLQHVVFCT